MAKLTPSLTALYQQPKGLYLLFFTELWERFGFYTLQTIIILYMTKSLLLTDHAANSLFAAFSALLYLTPMAGGYLADRYLGSQRAVMIGGGLFVLAYILSAFQNEDVFFLGLGVLICANGLFKPSVSSIVGELYSLNDPRREGGFTLFYMGINIGALIPPLIAGTLVTYYGWHAGFIVAAVGMLMGQCVFLIGRHYLGTAGLYPKGSSSSRAVPTYQFYSLLCFSIGLFIAICQIAFYHPAFTAQLIEVAAIGVVALVLFLLFQEKKAQRNRMLASLILIIISVGFWSLYNQTFSSLMLFADRNMGKSFMGIPIDAELTQFFNPFFIFMLSPFLSRLWVRLGHSGLNPSIQLKFSVGILLLSVGFFILAIGTTFFNQQGVVSPAWLIISYLLQTLGELLISPIGLAMITVLCPKKRVGLMMGVWFFSQAAAFAIGGSLANLAAVSPAIPASASVIVYSHTFKLYGCISLVMAIVSGCLIPFLNRLIKA